MQLVVACGSLFCKFLMTTFMAADKGQSVFAPSASFLPMYYSLETFRFTLWDQDLSPCRLFAV